MGLKKYEIITVGSDRRVRALRSWAVGDRYVNIGDVGGIVYDEKTLSQDGACWLFRGNFGFPGARIGGDSIVDVGEAALSAAGAPNVDILGSSVVVGSKLRFESGQTAADAVQLTGSHFEQGAFTYAAGVNWETMKAPSGNYLRTKDPIFAGGNTVTLKCEVPGYLLNWYALDRDGTTINASAAVTTGVGVTTTVTACQYFLVKLSKNPNASIVPADATAARIITTAVYETKLVVVDSRLELNQDTSNGVITIRPGGTYSVSSGAKYPDSVIQNSRVVINASSSRGVRFMSDLSNVNVTLDATTADAQSVGTYRSVNNLVFTGTITGYWDSRVRSLIQAYNCDNMVVSTTNFPGLVAMLSAGVPIRFYNCNLNNGLFYHHKQIANTYRDINFDLAVKDLGKSTANEGAVILCSSEVNGMYRLLAPSGSGFGCLAESHESVKSVSLAQVGSTYNTTIYADAYFDGKFDIAGTNVFGNKVRSHPLAQVLNVQPRAVQGNLTLTVGQRPTLVPGSLARVVINYPIRINTANGITVNNIPAGIQAAFACVDGQGNYVVISTWKEGTATVTNLAQLDLPAAYLMFKKANDGPITPEDLAGVTMTVYNGCKIVNTGATAVNLKGNIRVEDNATLVNASITGTGYFGGNSVVHYNPAVWAALECTGSAFMKDNAVFAPTSLVGSCALVHMQDNAKFIGSGARVSTELSFIMRDNAIIEGTSNTRSGVVMSGNAKVTSTGVIAAASRGALVMTDNASIEAATTVIGAITLAGNYKGNVVKTWIGKRTITDVNEPEYDNNVKTQYEHEHDF